MSQTLKYPPSPQLEVAGHALEEGEYSLPLQPKEGVACQALPNNDAIVVLDLELTPELIQEGMARDVIRVVQQARKEAGLHVADRIRLTLPIEGEWRDAVEAFREYVCDQTLATELSLGEQAAESSAFEHAAKLGGQDTRVGVSRVEQ